MLASSRLVWLLTAVLAVVYVVSGLFHGPATTGTAAWWLARRQA